MKIFICVFFLSLLGSFIYLKLTSVSSKTPITVSANQGGEQNIKAIKAAFKTLAKICPAVTKDRIERIDASYDGNLVKWDSWLYREYGWTENVNFVIKSSKSHRRYSEHTHYFHVATGTKAGVIINGKQESLELCGINAMMKDHLFIPAL